jgi:hypothetical protein
VGPRAGLDTEVRGKILAPAGDRTGTGNIKCTNVHERWNRRDVVGNVSGLRLHHDICLEAPKESRTSNGFQTGIQTRDLNTKRQA